MLNKWNNVNFTKVPNRPVIVLCKNGTEYYAKTLNGHFGEKVIMLDRSENGMFSWNNQSYVHHIILWREIENGIESDYLPSHETSEIESIIKSIKKVTVEISNDIKKIKSLLSERNDIIESFPVELISYKQ